MSNLKSAWNNYALNNGMKPCILCGEPVGGRCPPCDRVICYACTVAVKLPSGEIAWRCKECAAEMVLAHGGVVMPKRIESVEDGMIVDKEIP
jgi:uncharacterized membrane protein